VQGVELVTLQTNVVLVAMEVKTPWAETCHCIIRIADQLEADINVFR
jgi:hypothetical protein